MSTSSSTQELLLMLGILLLTILLLARGTWFERLTTLALIMAIIFYYTPEIESLILRFLSIPNSETASSSVGTTSNITRWLNRYQELVLKTIDFGGISIFGRTILNFSTDKQFSQSLLPLIVLFGGVGIRSIINLFVRTQKVKQITREYWLYITGYLIFAIIFSDITRINFLSIVVTIAITAFIVIAGVFRVSGDLIEGLLKIIRLIIQFIRILMKFIALIATKIAGSLKRLRLMIKHLYEQYILGPFRFLYNKVANLLRNIEKWLDFQLGRNE